MPNTTRRHFVAAAPLLQVSWSTKAKDKTKTAVITVGSPLLGILVLLAGTHFAWTRQAVRSVLATFGISR